jgi:hypothetical protein
MLLRSGYVFHQGFHHLVRAKLEGVIGVGGAEKVCPLEDFGKAELVEGNDDGAEGAFAADDEDFDGFALTP